MFDPKSFARMTTLILFLLFAHSPANADATDRTLLVFGDSLSAAYGIRSEKSWVTLLEQRLASSGYEVKTVNASISGETTGGGLKRLPEALETHHPDIVILELGANDGLRGFPLPLIKRNLSQLVKITQESGAKVLITGIHLPPNFGPAYTGAFFDLFKSVSIAHNTAYLPFLLDNVALVPGLLQPDGLHPTEEAQPIVLNNIWGPLVPLLGVH